MGSEAMTINWAEDDGVTAYTRAPPSSLESNMRHQRDGDAKDEIPF